MPFIIRQERETWNFREEILKFYIFYKNTYIFYIIEKVVLQYRLQGNKRGHHEEICGKSIPGRAKQCLQRPGGGGFISLLLGAEMPK